MQTDKRPGRKPMTALRLLAEIERDQCAIGACTATTEELATRVDRRQRQVYEALAQLVKSGRILRDAVADPRHPEIRRRRLRLP